MEVVNPFNALDAKDRLKRDPKTAEFMKDSQFVRGIDELASSHQALQK